jgi:diguanylate cyclase (GGDEF)-like protein
MTASAAAERRRKVEYRRVAVAMVAAALVAGAAVSADWPARLETGSAPFWLLAGFVVLGESMPIRIPRGTYVEETTISSAFALAFLLMFGAVPAIVVYAGACLVADAINRTAPAKTAFNAAQSILSMAAAAAIASAFAPGPPLEPAGGELAVTIAAALGFFVVDGALVAVAGSVLEGEPLWTHLRRDARFHTWTSGFMLTLAPLVVAGAERSAWLVPLLFCPTLAIYLGGRHAVRSAHRALHDELTGLPNRAMLYQRLDELLAAESHERAPFAVLLVDIDDFRSVNDTLGHQHGDVLVAAVASRLEAAVGPDAELIARVGGDELAIVFAGDIDPHTAAKRTADALAAPFLVSGLGLEVRVSIGVALHPDHARDTRELVQRADVALHRAKQERTLYDVYRAENDEFTIDRLLLAGQLRRGVEGGQLVVHYQPKVALSDGRPHGVEALVRWRHPELGLLSPAAFIPLAEHTGLVRQLTDVVVDTAIGQCAAWRSAGHDLVVAVNLSPRTLADTELPGRIAASLERWEVPGSALQVEITESGVVADEPAARRVLDELHEMGVTCAIDDFGTGYSSLGYLRQRPIDVVKIDKTFIDHILDDPQQLTLVSGIVSLARSLNLTVVAEGIESPRHREVLAEMGCPLGQGYLYSSPIGATEALSWMTRTEAVAA